MGKNSSELGQLPSLYLDYDRTKTLPRTKLHRRMIVHIKSESDSENISRSVAERSANAVEAEDPRQSFVGEVAMVVGLPEDTLELYEE